MTTIAALIETLSAWRDLKKIDDAKVLLFDHGTGTWLDIEQVTFGANGAIYIQGEAPAFDMVKFAATEALTSLRDRVEAQQGEILTMIDDALAPLLQEPEWSTSIATNRCAFS